MSLTGAAFLVSFAGGLWLAVFRHPRYGLYTYVAVFYLHPPSRWWGETLPDLRWALVAAVVTLIVTLRLPAEPGRPSWLRTTPAKALLLFTGWLWIQSLWALDPVQHQEACLLFTKYVVLYYLIYRLVLTPADVSRFLLVHLLGCAYLGWLAFSTDVSGRLEGVGGPGIDEANAFAMQMGTGVVAGAMIALTMPGARRWGAILALPFILNGVILSGSRGGFLALIAGGLVLWYLKPLEYRKLFYVFACLGLIVFGRLAHDIFWNRIISIEAVAERNEAAMDDSALSRFALIQAQMRMAADYPFGTGHRGTAVLSPRYLDERFLSVTATEEQKRQRSSHNTFMTALVEQGSPGAVWFVWIFGWSAIAVVRIKARSAGDIELRAALASVAAGLAVVLVAGIFVDYLKTEVQVWLWGLLAAMLAFDPALAKRSVADTVDGAPGDERLPAIVPGSGAVAHGPAGTRQGGA